MSDEELAGLDYEAFRAVMGSFASGVTVVTTLDPAGRPWGLTCSAVCSVSADPPLLLTCVRTPSRTLDALRASGGFVVNFLSAGARGLSQLFAGPKPAEFDGIGWSPGRESGIPVLDGVLAHAECRTHQLIEAGDHVVVIGLLVAGGVNGSAFPLGYWRGSYMRVYHLDSGAAAPVEDAPGCEAPAGEAETGYFDLERIIL